ncbi:glycerophosphodiester phosphodiesterase family protein [Microbacterium chocolatum]|uniref:glycerophosphodiester phosphodiesterase n=1 Tax=Microbacterium aurantiacum TaxID=162393 RepID=UPI00339018DB
MPHDPARDRLASLVIACALAVVAVAVAVVGASPARVSAGELLGDTRDPGDAAFIASHRGGAAVAPENTLEAVRIALDAGFSYVEVDVARTADGHAVLLHDATVDRTTDGTGRLEDLDLSEVRSLDAGSWYSAEYAGARVPTLEEFLDVLAASDARAILELKGEWDGSGVARVLSAIHDRRLDDRVAAASFDATALAHVAAQSETVHRMLILRRLPDDAVRAAVDAGVRALIVDRAAVIDRPAVVEELHDAGVRVVVYTLNTDAHWDEVTALGVDGIITDDPFTLSDWQDGVARSR